MVERGRKSQKDKLMKAIRVRPLISTKEAEQIGVSRLQLTRLAKQGKLNRVSQGLFHNPSSSLQGVDLDYSIACKRLGPNSAIGGLSALFHYSLAEQVPQQIWVMVDSQARPRIPLYRAIRTSTPLNIEVEQFKSYRIVTIERALLEALRFSSKIGLETALKAIRKALKEKTTTLSKLEQAAKRLGLKKYIVKYWEAIVS
jgi:predicted transcriptional regulator of viral defense system